MKSKEQHGSNNLDYITQKKIKRENLLFCNIGNVYTGPNIQYYQEKQMRVLKIQILKWLFSSFVFLCFLVFLLLFFMQLEDYVVKIIISQIQKKPIGLFLITISNLKKFQRKLNKNLNYNIKGINKSYNIIIRNNRFQIYLRLFQKIIWKNSRKKREKIISRNSRS